MLLLTQFTLAALGISKCFLGRGKNIMRQQYIEIMRPVFHINKKNVLRASQETTCFNFENFVATQIQQTSPSIGTASHFPSSERECGGAELGLPVILRVKKINNTTSRVNAK